MRDSLPRARRFFIIMSRLMPGRRKPASKPMLPFSCNRIWPRRISLSVNAFTGSTGITTARLRSMAPASLDAKIQTGYVDFWWKGDTKLLKSLVDQVPAGTDPDGVITSVRWDVSMMDRDFSRAKEVLEKSPLSDISYTNAG